MQATAWTTFENGVRKHPSRHPGAALTQWQADPTRGAEPKQAPCSDQTIQSALTFAAALRDTGRPPPAALSLDGEAGFTFEWHAAECWVYCDVTARGILELSVLDRDACIAEGTFPDPRPYG